MSQEPPDNGLLAQLTQQQQQTFREAFSMFAKDDPLKINREELRLLMRALGQNPTDQRLQRMMEQFDDDKDGKIDFDVFANLLWHEMQNVESEDGIEEAFKVFDMDGDGLVSVDEWRHVMCDLGIKLNESEVSEMLKEAVYTDTGLIDYDETIDKLLKIIGQPPRME